MAGEQARTGLTIVRLSPPSNSILAGANGNGGSVKTASGMIQLMHPIPDDVWDKAAEIVLREIRAETGIPNWLPKLLNGRDEFEKRVVALVQSSQQP